MKDFEMRRVPGLSRCDQSNYMGPNMRGAGGSEPQRKCYDVGFEDTERRP